MNDMISEKARLAPARAAPPHSQHERARAATRVPRGAMSQQIEKSHTKRKTSHARSTPDCGPLTGQTCMIVTVRVVIA
jgi:hypothetical protein